MVFTWFTFLSLIFYNYIGYPAFSFLFVSLPHSVSSVSRHNSLIFLYSKRKIDHIIITKLEKYEHTFGKAASVCFFSIIIYAVQSVSDGITSENTYQTVRKAARSSVGSTNLCQSIYSQYYFSSIECSVC